MRVIFTGTGAGGNYTGDRGGASVLMESDNSAALVDCGPGVDRRIFQSGVEYSSLTAIFLTHLHYDHMVSLPEVLNRYGRRGGSLPRIFGPRETDQFVQDCKKLVRVSTSAGLPEQFRTLIGEVASETELVVGDLNAKSLVVPHDPNIESLAWRLEIDGQSVVISGDQCADESKMIEFSIGADLLVHEAYSEDGLNLSLSRLPTEHAREQGRLKYRPTHTEVHSAARIAEAAGVKHLALTHLMPSEDEESLVEQAGEIFAGDCFVAQPGQSIDL